MRFKTRNPGQIEAFQLPDPDDEEGIAAFHEWSKKWNFEWESDRDCSICFRRKQSMDDNDWVNVQPGEWIIFGVFDFQKVDDYTFTQAYEPV